MLRLVASGFPANAHEKTLLESQGAILKGTDDPVPTNHSLCDIERHQLPGADLLLRRPRGANSDSQGQFGQFFDGLHTTQFHVVSGADAVAQKIRLHEFNPDYAME